MSLLRKIWEKSFIRPIYWSLYRLHVIRRIRYFIGARYRDLLLGRILPAFYDKRKDVPINENKVLFVEYRSDTLSDNYRLLWGELKKNTDFDLHFHNLANGFARRREYLRRCRRFLADMADARDVFVNEPNEVISCVDLRPETKVMQVWHACGAFKKWGMSTAEKIFGADEKTLHRHPNYANLSWVTVSSPEVIWAYAEAMDLEDKKETIVPIGVSRTDVFYDEERKKKAFEKLYEVFPAARGKKVILYAPTFRGRVSKAQAPDQLDVRAFAEAFSDEYVLISKHHPYIRELPEIPEELNGTFSMDVTSTMNIEDLLMVSDICISDYSSLIFEYSLMERPMIFFAYDLEDYFDWRGFYYPYDEFSPGPVCRTNDEMITYIRNIDTEFDRQKVIDFRNKFMSACDGHATERALDLMFGADVLAAHAKKKPEQNQGKEAE